MRRFSERDHEIPRRIRINQMASASLCEVFSSFRLQNLLLMDLRNVLRAQCRSVEEPQKVGEVNNNSIPMLKPIWNCRFAPPEKKTFFAVHEKRLILASDIGFSSINRFLFFGGQEAISLALSDESEKMDWAMWSRDVGEKHKFIFGSEASEHSTVAI